MGLLRHIDDLLFLDKLIPSAYSITIVPRKNVVHVLTKEPVDDKRMVEKKRFKNGVYWVSYRLSL